MNAAEHPNQRQHEIEAFLAPNETFWNLFQRVNLEPVRSTLAFFDRQVLHGGDVVEVHGAAGTAKTEVLLQIAVTYILPKEWEGVEYGGCEASVLYLDLDARFDSLRLNKALESRMAQAQAQARANAGQGERMGQRRNSGQSDGGQNRNPLDDVFLSSLGRFHLLQCFNSFQFLMALKTVPSKNKHLKDSGAPGIQLILLDNIGAFYWLDRAARRSLWATPPPPPGTPMTLDVVFEAIVRDLKYIIHEFHPLIVATKTAIYPAGRRDFYGGEVRLDDGKVEEFLPLVWKEFVSHRLLLSSAPQPLGTVDVQHPAFPSHTFLAQWEKPSSTIVDVFRIREGFVQMIQQGYHNSPDLTCT